MLQKIRGCSFHYCQAIIRQVRHLGLGDLYADKDSDAHSAIRMLCALPLLSPGNVRPYWRSTLRPRLQRLGLEALAIYFDNYWMA